jgi:hypothetical protein
VQNNERYLAFPPAVPQAFLEGSDIVVNFFKFTFKNRIAIGMDRLQKSRAAAQAEMICIALHFPPNMLSHCSLGTW